MPRIGSKWLHRASGGVYTIICNAKVEDNLADVVVYRGDNGQVWVRPTTKFLDGRYSPMPEA